MKKLWTVLVSTTILMTMLNTASMAASGEIFDFSEITVNEESNLPTGWGNLGGSRISQIKPGEFDLISDKKYLEITNNTQTNASGTPPLFRSIQQFKDYVTLEEGDTLLMTATVMANDLNFSQVGLFATRANVTYTDVDGKIGSVADVDFSGSPPLLAFCYDAGMVWLNSWGKDVTPEGFDFEINRFYKLDVIFKGGENKIDIYLDGEFLETVDYSGKFADMLKSNIAYDFTDTTKYQNYRISQVKRLAVAQNKPGTYTGQQVCGWYNVGYRLYGEADVMPELTFKTDDFSVKAESEYITAYNKGTNVVMKQKAAKVKDILISFETGGTIKLYKDKACSIEYADDEWIAYPAYLSYYGIEGFKVFEIPLVTDFYAENTNIVKSGSKATFSGKMTNIGSSTNSSVILVVSYKEGELLQVKMQKVDVNPGESKSFSVSVDIDAECDEVLGWVIDNWQNRSILSDVYKIIID